MEIISFSAISSIKEFRTLRCAGPPLEACFDIMTNLVKAGWLFLRVELMSHPAQNMTLPVEAFDGYFFTKHIDLIR